MRWLSSASLLLMGSSLGVGCFSPPPEYETPQQIPPFILQAEVVPPLDQFHVVQPGQSWTLTVPFRSEDLQEPVEAQVLLDSQPGFAPVFDIDNTVIAASTLDQVRTADLSIRIPQDYTGCHTLTMVLTHQSNIQGSAVIDIRRADWVTWWLDIRQSADADPSRVEQCPEAGSMESRSEGF